MDGLLLLLRLLLSATFAVAGIIPTTSLCQTLLPQDMLARTAALFTATNGGMTVLGAMLGGLLGNAIGARPTLAIAVAGMALAPLIAAFSPLRHLTAMAAPAPHPPDAAAGG